VDRRGDDAPVSYRVRVGAVVDPIAVRGRRPPGQEPEVALDQHDVVLELDVGQLTSEAVRQLLHPVMALEGSPAGEDDHVGREVLREVVVDGARPRHVEMSPQDNS
jgi:hypothetical protein